MVRRARALVYNIQKKFNDSKAKSSAERRVLGSPSPALLENNFAF